MQFHIHLACVPRLLLHFHLTASVSYILTLCSPTPCAMIFLLYLVYHARVFPVPLHLLAFTVQTS